MAQIAYVNFCPNGRQAHRIVHRSGLTDRRRLLREPFAFMGRLHNRSQEATGCGWARPDQLAVGVERPRDVAGQLQRDFGDHRRGHLPGW